jgi:hypothetical protein
MTGEKGELGVTRPNLLGIMITQRRKTNEAGSIS